MSASVAPVAQAPSVSAANVNLQPEPATVTVFPPPTPTSAAAPVAPAPHKSILEEIGHELKVVFEEILPVAQAEEPFIDALFPAIGPIYNLVVTQVMQAEMAAVSAGLTGAGTQKVAMVASAVEPAVIALLQGEGIRADRNHVRAYIESVVAGLKAFPARRTAA